VPAGARACHTGNPPLLIAERISWAAQLPMFFCRVGAANRKPTGDPHQIEYPSRAIPAFPGRQGPVIGCSRHTPGGKIQFASHPHHASLQRGHTNCSVHTLAHH